MGQFSLDESENQAVQAGAAGYVKSAAVARLYTSPDGSWHYAHLWGAAALVTDDNNVAYIRLIDLGSSQIIWEQEFYEGIDYQSPTPFFHTFEGSESVVGLSFADEEDAGYFYEAVTSMAASYQAGGGSRSGGGASYSSTLPPVPTSNGPSLPPKPAVRSPGPPPPVSGAPPPRPTGGPPPRPAEPAPAPPTRGPSYGSGLDYQSTPSPATPPQPVMAPAPTPSPAPVAAAPPPAGKGGSFIGGASTGGGGSKRQGKKKGWFSKITEKIGLGEEQGQPDIVLGGPTGFRHESHIGWDPSAGFEIRNIPPEWRKLFQAAGVKKSELKDGATAQFIMETVVEATMGMNPGAAARPGGGGPPPPPVPGAPAPPPAPSAPAAPPPPSAPAPPPPPSAPNAPPPPSFNPGGGGGAGGLLASLQTATLKSVDQRTVPDLNNLDEQQGASLADTLAKAMAARRVDLGADEPEEELGSEDEWSD